MVVLFSARRLPCFPASRGVKEGFFHYPETTYFILRCLRSGRSRKEEGKLPKLLTPEDSADTPSHLEKTALVILKQNDEQLTFFSRDYIWS